jgi:hypothetical protein
LRGAPKHARVTNLEVQAAGSALLDVALLKLIDAVNADLSAQQITAYA